uniref:NAC transcription factor 078 n=1 Tax=Rhizophora mucronata TaxID=61149 RepID=A0A2P2IQ78_RHIMU
MSHLPCMLDPVFGKSLNPRLKPITIFCPLSVVKIFFSPCVSFQVPHDATLSILDPFEFFFLNLVKK